MGYNRIHLLWLIKHWAGNVSKFPLASKCYDESLIVSFTPREKNWFFCKRKNMAYVLWLSRVNTILIIAWNAAVACTIQTNPSLALLFSMGQNWTNAFLRPNVPPMDTKDSFPSTRAICRSRLVLPFSERMSLCLQGALLFLEYYSGCDPIHSYNK